MAIKYDPDTAAVVTGTSLKAQCKACGLTYPITQAHLCPGKIQHIMNPSGKPLCGVDDGGYIVASSVPVCVQCHQIRLTEMNRVQYLYVSADDPPLCGAEGKLWQPTTAAEAESAGVCLRCHRKARRKWEGKGVRRAVEWFPFPHEVEDRLLDIAQKIEDGSIG